MRTLFLLFAIVVQIPLSICVKAQTESARLTDAEKTYILGKLCTEVKYNYVFYPELAFDWDSLCQATLPSILESKTDNEFIFRLKYLMAQLHDGHTSIQGKVAESSEWIRPLPLQTKRIDNRVFVTKVLNSALAQLGVVEGTEILQIDGLGVVAYGDRYIRPYTSSSTAQWSKFRPYNEFELTKGVGSDTIQIVFKNKDKKAFEYKSSRNVAWDLANDNKIFDYKVIDNNIGWLKITTFMGDDFLQQFDKLYEEILNTDKLIIDLRDNGGGNSNYADYILRHLSSSTIRQTQWSSRMYIAAYGSWNYPQTWYTQDGYPLNPVRGKTIYTKPIVVLTNATTFSSSENFCAIFRGMKRGKIVGSTTGGSTGNPIMIDLGHGISALICTKNDLHLDGTRFNGIGILPDIECSETTDLFVGGRDVVLEEAIKQL